MDSVSFESTYDPAILNYAMRATFGDAISGVSGYGHGQWAVHFYDAPGGDDVALVAATAARAPMFVIVEPAYVSVEAPWA